MTTSVVTRDDRRLAAGGAGRFTPNHPWDRNVFLLYVALIWTGILMGFGPQIVRHVTQHKPPYPIIVHVHAAAFVGWLVLLTTQVLLIRGRHFEAHRRLGVAGAGLALIMIVVGPTTALIVDHLRFGTPDSDPPFLSVQLLDIVAFTGLVTAAIVLRGQASAHKRLILLATLFISDAGFARWFGGPLTKLLGAGFWPFMVESYLANDLLIFGLGAYDLVTRRRLHPVYMAGLVWVLANQMTASWLYVSPAWKPIALKLIGH